MSLDTRGIDPQRLLPRSLEDRLLGWLARVCGAGLGVCILFIWLSLATWSLSDPSLTHATATEPRNWMGPMGAILSDLLLQTLGFASVVALVAPMAWTFEALRDQHIRFGRMKLGFYPLSILAIAAALSALPVFNAWPLHHGFGGVLGDGVFKLTANVFGMINEDRASLAAGLVLSATAATTFAKSIGLDIEETMQSLFKRETFVAVTAASYEHGTTAVDPRAGPAQKSQSKWWPRATTTKRASQENPYGAAAGIAVPQPRPAPRQWTRDETLPHLSSYGAPFVAAPAGLVAASGGGHAYAQAAGTSFGGQGFEAQNHSAPPFDFGTPVGGPHHDGLREPGFDFSTDAASSAIARRFAPGATEQAHVPAPAPAQAKPSIFGKTSAAPKAAGLLSGMTFGKGDEAGVWKRPSLNLLKRAPASKPGPEFTQTVMRGNARLLEDALADFGVKGEVKDIKPGPVITLYELEPARGTKSSRVIGLADDIARSMSIASVRAAVVPGRNAIGLELPNVRREPVLLREILESPAYTASDALLPLTLGKSIGGEPVVADLARMPHLLVAGTTGSGKSVGVNAMILSLLYRHSPEDCRLIMIDPKMLELSVYNGIPHLLTPVVTDPQKAVAALNWAVTEMEERYKRMASLSVRNIDVFNNRVKNAKKRGEMLSRTVQTGFDQAGQAKFENQKMDLEPLPHIVIVVDEFADLMMVSGKEVEGAVQRLAQMARAAGIHLIMATQRPSVDVVTGTIRSNFPTRISFKMTSKVDSRTILNEQGAEQLLGQGDMLYSTGSGQIVRVHGAFVSDEEVEAIADALRKQGPPDYVMGIADAPSPAAPAGGERETSDDDLYDRAVAVVLRDRKASTSYIQRRLSIGYNRAADIIERMERDGLISAANPVGKREILVAGSGAADAA